MNVSPRSADPDAMPRPRQHAPAQTTAPGPSGLRPLVPPIFWVLLLTLHSPWTARAQVAPASGTHAARGAAWGAVVGGVLGGAGIGLLSWGLCDAADCGGSFAEGFVAGALVGAASGMVVGTVVGSALPRGGPSLGGWSWTVRAGARAALAQDVDGVGPDVGFEVSRGVTDRVRVGVTAEYLGRAEENSSFSVVDRDGNVLRRTQRRTWTLMSVRMEAERLVAPGDRHAGWVSAGFGIYPARERDETSGTGELPASTFTKWVPAPGISGGLGLRLGLADRWSLDLGAHGDLVVGIGSESVLPILRLGIGLRRAPP